MPATSRLFIPFGEFKPDSGHFLSNGLTVVNGALPSGDKFLPIPNFGIRSDALGSSLAQTVRAHVNVNPPGAGAAQIYVLIGNVLYVANTAVDPWGVSTIAASGGFVIGTDADAGDMFGFGQHEIFTQGHTNEILYRASGAGNVTALVTTTADYPDRPRAKFGCAVGDRILIANIANATPLAASTPDPNPDMWWLSKSRDATIFGDEAHPADGRSGYGFLYDDLGPIMGLSGNKDYALIFKKRGLYRMDFTGAFGNTFRAIPASYGTRSHRTINRLGNDVFFWSDAGPCVYRNDQVFQLSAGRINDFLTNSTLFARNKEVSAFLGSSVDQVNQTITWLYTYRDDTNAAYIAKLTYNVQYDLFSMTLNMASNSISGPQGTAFDNDNTGIPAFPACLIDGLPAVAPEAAFMGSVMVVELAPDVGGDTVRLCTYGAANETPETTLWWGQDTVFKTGFYALGQEQYAHVKKVRVVARANSAAAMAGLSVRVLTKDKPWADAVSAGYKSDQDERGFISTLDSYNSQFQQFEVTFARRDDGPVYASDLKEIEGIEVEFEVKGQR